VSEPIIGRPIFVGGVSRSGTTVVGKHLLGRHHDIACTIPAEMWFITNTGGVCDLVAAKQSLGASTRARANALRRGAASPMSAFRARMEGFWYRRDWWKDGRSKGLFQSVPEDRLAAALDDFEAAYRSDPTGAARQLIADIIDTTVRERGKRRWVDTTPDSARNVDALYRLYPDLRLVNMVRDGRDVAASIVGRDWGTDDYFTALDQWFRGMKEGHRAIHAVPAGSVLTIQLERLLSTERDQQYGRLLAFLEIDDSPKMRAFFDRRMNPEAGHVGRWRADTSGEVQARIDERYQEMTDRLDDMGVARADDLIDLTGPGRVSLAEQAESSRDLRD
jgi:Sulfotransferase family